MKYKVFISSQNMREILFETDSEKEALNFCEQNHWELRDENDLLGIYIMRKHSFEKAIGFIGCHLSNICGREIYETYKLQCED